MKLSLALAFSLLLGLAAPGIGCAQTKTNTTPTKAAHADAKEAAKLVTKGDVVVLDIRTPSEYSAGHIGGATNINYQADDFAAQIGKLDREKTYLVHCASGRRSTNSLPAFEKLGFKKIIHLDGGIKGWEAAGNPVEKK